MAKMLQIAELGRPVLRQKAEVVQSIPDPVIQDLIDDLLAIIFQHEFDHLDGVVYLDRMVNLRDLVTEKEFHRIQSTA